MTQQEFNTTRYWTMITHIDRNILCEKCKKRKKKIMRRTTTSERKQVFASNSKFQIESVRKQVTYSK